LSNGIIVIDVFITHAHFDHIYGINELIDLFPGCIVYASEESERGLFSSELNLSLLS
jgi:glyoxylase-like metal-dependent hydrolase (beta-lactamase superfamily II)